MNDIRGQFRPSGIAVVCVCVCPWVRMCVNPELVRTITRHPFTLYQIWTRNAKTHWLRSLLFKGWLIKISKANSILNIQIFIAFGLSTKVNTHYNMVGSALFLQRALYTVHCTNTMHSRKPSFAITPAVYSQHCKSLFCNICGNEIRHILLKQFHLITLDINTIKHPCISPCT